MSPPSPPVEDLLVRWEEAREQGRPPSAEELCREQPHLLAEVRRRLDAIGRVDHLLTTSLGDEVSGDTSSFHEDGPAHTRATVAPGLTPTAPALPARYEVVARLGQGGMGVVYHARDLLLRRDV